MKKYLFLLFIGVTNLLAAQGFRNAYEQLASVNEQWKNQMDVDPSLKSSPAKQLTEQQLVQFHLQQTESMLRKRDISPLSPALKKQRQSNLNTLHTYWTNGVFPVNDQHQNRQPYFIDKFNTYCAVGYLMKMNGADNMARQIQNKQNFSYLFDISHPQLMDWVSKSGLTLDELALIQPGYGGEMPVTLLEMHYNNAGADVNEYIEVKQSTGGLIGMPLFDSLIFLDAVGSVYKRLAISALATGTNSTFLYYSFPSGDSFADIGSVIIKRHYVPTYQDTLSFITYNAATVTFKNYLNNSVTTTTYNVGESESTAIGSSLGFCGSYGSSSWNFVAGANTMGTLNPCASFATPITLSSFSYAINNKKVNLSWETVTEINNSYFSIEKSSNGTNFQSIGTINGAGTSNSPKQYTFTDDKPNYINQYRLKQVDLDGRSTYSKILFVKVQQASPVSITGNPVKKQLQVHISLETNKATSLNIFDFMGRKIKAYSPISGFQNLDVSALPSGKYLLQLLTSDGQAFNLRFVKAD